MDRRAFLKSIGIGLSGIFPRGISFRLGLGRQAASGRTLERFSTPAMIRDLHGSEQALLDHLWHTNLEALTQQAIFGNPWSKAGMSHLVYYLNPISTLIPQGTQSAMVSWTAFPNRLNQYFGTPTALPPNPHNLPQEAVWELADYGFHADELGKRHSFPEIPKNLCPQADWKGPLRPFGPYGPRGWQDEYCEWSVTRNQQGKITRVDFTCENPEYWNTLWRISPERVVQIYQEILNFGLPSGSPDAIRVARADLELRDPNTGKPVLDPSTGAPAYNPLNRWNRGPVSSRGVTNASGGAVHLTCTANTLQAELVGVAAVSTLLRDIGNNDAQQLGCCSQNTQPYRNSDFHIGQILNQIVGSGPQGRKLTVADPVALYIQKPDFSGYALPDDPKLPKGATVADCWQIVRGSETLRDPVSGQMFPGNFILHAVFQLPASWIQAGVSFTVGDITIKHNGVATPVRYAAQIVETFQIGIFAWPIPAEAPEPPQACVVDLKQPQVEPNQLLYEDLWNACYGTAIDNPLHVPMNLASNSVAVPAQVPQGATGLRMVLLCGTVTLGPNGELPTVTVPDSDIAVKVTGARNISHVICGHSYPAPFHLLTLRVDVPGNARPGLRDIQVTNFNQAPGPPAPAFLNVVAGMPA